MCPIFEIIKVGNPTNYYLLNLVIIIAILIHPTTPVKLQVLKLVLVASSKKRVT